MIPATSTITQTDTLPGDETEFSIGNPKWVMRALADLYSDITTAVIREYSTNAADAEVMAGTNKAIEVTLPSMMNPHFKVKDRGVGMSATVLREVYTSFGDSDKRDSNDVNGMLGFGCKAAAAYTTTFTVTSVFEGMKTVAVITRKPDWSITLKVVAHVKTDERNGTEVSVPVHNIDEFCQKAKDFYRFWKPGTVLINGKEPVQDVGEKITEGLYYSTHWNQSYVVMGNVGYRINNPDALFTNSKMKRINFVAYVDNGDVEFSNSREDLKYTQQTKDTLARVIADFEDEIVAQAQSEIDNAQSHFDAFLLWSEWRNRLGSKMFEELSFGTDKFEAEFKIDATRYRPQQYGYSTYKINSWSVDSMTGTLVITQYDGTLNSSHKAKAREYSSHKGLNTRNYLFTPQADVDSVWVDKSTFITWEDLKAALPKKPPKQRVYVAKPGRIKGTFDYATRHGMKWEQDVPDDVNLYYITVADSKATNEQAALRLLDDNGVVVILAANRIDKFVRENPKAKSFLTYAQSKVVLDGPSLLNKEAKEALAIGYNTKRWLETLDVTKIDDPEFTRVRGLFKDKNSSLSAYENNLSLAGCVGMVYNVKKHTISASDDSLVNKYPLLDDIGIYSRNHKHIYIYLNAAYAAN